MPRSKEIQEQMRNKIVDLYQSGKGYKAMSKALGLQRTTVRAIYPQMEKTWNSGEPSQEWPAYQIYSKSATTTHPGGHKELGVDRYVFFRADADTDYYRPSRPITDIYVWCKN